MLSMTACILLAGLLGACTSLGRSDMQSVRIETEPAGAEAHVRYGPHCVTPCTVRLRRDESYMIWLSKQGCTPETLLIAPQLRADWYSTPVDHWSGDVYTLAPNPLKATLVCRNAEVAGS